MDTIDESLTHCIGYAKMVRSINSAKTYNNALNHFREYLTYQKLNPKTDLASLISMMHFSQFPAWLSEQGYSKKTINVYLAGIQFYLDYLVINGFLEPTYTEVVRHKQALKIARGRRETRLPRTPQKGAVERILTVANTMQWSDNDRRNEILRARNLAIVELLASTGCRNSEITNLKIKNIDMSDHSAIVVGKGSKERRVYFSETAANAMQEYWNIRGARGGNYPAFSPHSQNTKIMTCITTESIRKMVRALVMAAGLEKGTFTPHYFRHAFAIKMLHETSNLAIVQDLLGHSTPTATRVYAKIYPEELHKAHHDVYG